MIAKSRGFFYACGIEHNYAAMSCLPIARTAPIQRPDAFRAAERLDMSAIEKQSTAIKGGKRTGAGRKKGIPNKRTAEIQAQVAAEGITPLEFMLKIMRTEPGDDIEDPRVLSDILSMRFEAAKAAAPYVHAKLAAIDITGDVKLGVTIVATPLDERL